MNEVMSDPLLRVELLEKRFNVKDSLFGSSGSIRAVDGVSFEVPRGVTFGIVGESGSGKSTMVMCIARLLDATGGRLYFEGQEYTNVKGRKLRELRSQIQIVFQNPISSLDPHMRVKSIILEPLKSQGKLDKDADQDKIATDLLSEVGISPSFADHYPHELSGGQSQRVSIARALSLRPKLVILDEPTSALDPSIQAQILNLFNDLQRSYGITYLLVSHDLSVIGHMCDQVAVTYAGKIVEIGSFDQIFYEPSHPYTAALLASSNFIEDRRLKDRFALHGDPPSPKHLPKGCSLHPRCNFATDVCRQEYPLSQRMEAGHQTSCHHYDQVNLEALSPEAVNAVP